LPKKTCALTPELEVMQGAKTHVASASQEKLPAQKRAQHRGAPVIFKNAPQTVRTGAAIKSVRFGAPFTKPCLACDRVGE
jgi:hypothetical protein